MKPIVKWAGGKTQLLEHIETMLPTTAKCIGKTAPFLDQMIPSHFVNYFEPFLGGGAVLLKLAPESATVNDINTELINMYRQVKENPYAVIDELARLDYEHEMVSDVKHYYYYVREMFNLYLGQSSPQQAARLIYLNKHCFNGLYRVNSHGLFNVPFNNKKSGNSFDTENILRISAYLQKVNILNVDFEEAVADAKAGDFVFFDSPYVPLNPTSFTDYTKEGFGYEEHLRLARLYKRLSEQGVYCMLTNHNTELVNELYKDFHIKVVQVSRNINSNASARKGEEVIITNYEL